MLHRRILWIRRGHLRSTGRAAELTGMVGLYMSFILLSLRGERTNIEW